MRAARRLLAGFEDVDEVHPVEPAADGDEAVASQESAPTLPATGLPAFLLAGAGAMLLASGVALRRRVS